MKGIILAGGTGSRLHPLTKTLNKHILPVYDRPMICWPLKTLTDNGIEDITIVSSPSGVGQIAGILGGGKKNGWKCNLTYRVQDHAGGIVHALNTGLRDTGGPVAVILGDNIFLDSPMFWHGIGRPSDSMTIFTRAIPDKEKLSGFGVVEFNDDQTISMIVEKPKEPPSQSIVTGLYVLSLDGKPIPDIEPWQRGELEITDLINTYSVYGRLNDHVFAGEFWGDAGTIEGLYECSSACEKWVKSTQ